MKKFFSPNYNHRRDITEQDIDMVIIHYTEISLDETIAFFNNPKREVSAHFIICEDGELLEPVSLKYRAWHAGKSFFAGVTDINSRSVGIEIVNDGKSVFKKNQYDTLISLLNRLKTSYNLKDRFIIGHSDIAPMRKQDPGQFFNWQLLAENGHGIFYNLDIPKDNPIIIQAGEENDNVLEIQKKLSKIGYKIPQNSKFDTATEKTIIAFKSHYCPKTKNNIFDQYSLNILEKLEQECQ